MFHSLHGENGIYCTYASLRQHNAKRVNVLALQDYKLYRMVKHKEVCVLSVHAIIDAQESREAYISTWNKSNQ